MVSISEFIAEIESDFSTYTKDIDKVSIKYDVIEQLRKFGLNIAENYEIVLQVQNSKAQLPDNFKSLNLALKLSPQGCDTSDLEDLYDSYIYKERIESPRYFDEVNQEYINPTCSKVVTEVIHYKNKNYKFYYDYEWLSLAEGLNKTDLSADCLNLHPMIQGKYPYRISITNNTLNTNFSEGQIYLQYKSLPVDENGEVVIPEYTTGDILTYITQYVKIRIAEKLIVNNLNPIGIQQLYPVWKQEIGTLRQNAKKEARFHGLGTNWHKIIKAKNRKETVSFNLPNLNF